MQVARHIGRLARYFRGADCFVRFLGVLGPGLILADEWRKVRLAVYLFDLAANGADRFGNNLHAVGPHVSDETNGFATKVDALIEALGDLHGLLGGEAEFARGIHLQGRGCKRRKGVSLDRLLFN